MSRLHLLLFAVIACSAVLWTAGLGAVQDTIPPIEVHRLTDKLHMLGSGMETGGNIAVFIA